MSYYSWLFGNTINTNSSSTSVDAIVNRVKPLIVFGKYKTGKSWFLSLLFKSLGLSDTTIEYGDAIQTRGLQYYEGTVTEYVNKSVYGFFDSEGDFQHSCNVQDNITIFSAITSIPGVIVFLVRSFDSNDEKILIQLCQMVPASQRNQIIVIHNCSNASPQSLTSIKRNLIDNGSFLVPIIDSGNFELLSDINGHVVKHLFLVNHKNTVNIKHNETVAREVIRYTYSVVPRKLDDIDIVIQYKVNRMNLSLYRFYLNYQLVGLEFPSQVSIYYRILDNSEIRETDLISKNPLIDENIFASDISNMALCKGEPSERFRVLEIFGNIKYEKTILKIGGALHESDPHFNILSVVNGVEVEGEPNPQDSHLYTPDVIDYVIGRTMKNNCLFIFVRLISKE